MWARRGLSRGAGLFTSNKSGILYASTSITGQRNAATMLTAANWVEEVLDTKRPVAILCYESPSEQLDRVRKHIEDEVWRTGGKTKLLEVDVKKDAALLERLNVPPRFSFPLLLTYYKQKPLNAPLYGEGLDHEQILKERIEATSWLFND